MNKSIIERIFPHPAASVLPQYEEESPRPASSSSSSNRISLRDSSRASPGSKRPARSPIQSAPLSASVVHHDDPFLPVQRAAKSLERTLQSLIDAQSDALEATLPKDTTDDASSVGSPTPTPSIAGTPRHDTTPKTVPIRQPKAKKISLRSARRGLLRTMEEFAKLKDEELNVVQAETRSREDALLQNQLYKAKRTALNTEMEGARSDESRAGADSLRSEAAKVQQEIHELESRLFELRTRHRHLLAQADQYENTIDSKLSSYNHSLSAIDRDVRQFLRHPPVPCSLSNYDQSHSTRRGMYALKADRRTLDMAQEQWTAEQALLQQRKSNAEKEQLALLQGIELWRAATDRISTFEKDLRQKVRSGDPVAEDALVRDLDALAAGLHADLAVAERNGWRLLLVCVGAELAALRRARLLLAGSEDPAGGTAVPIEHHGAADLTGDEPGDPPTNLLDGGGDGAARRDSVGSNQSLQDTLQQFSDGGVKGKGAVRLESPVVSPQRQQSTHNPPSDSEDDDPGPDLLVSHA